MSKTQNLLPEETSLLHHVPFLPIAVYTQSLSARPNHEMVHTWYDIMTLLFVKEGNMDLEISNKIIHLGTHDCILINEKRKHRLYSPDQKDCIFSAVLFSPRIFLLNYPEYEYIDLTSADFPSYHLITSSDPDNKQTIYEINQILQLWSAKVPFQSFQILGHLHLIAAAFLLSVYQKNGHFRINSDPDYQSLQKMKNFVHDHYSEKIFLEEVASAGEVCRSRCCSIFQKYLHCTPGEYITDFRLKISRNYLMDHATSIADVADICGFSGQSYYTKLFVRKYHCTPGQFRASNLKPASQPQHRNKGKNK